MHRGLAAARLVIGIILAFAFPASAGNWRALGPGGGRSRLVASDPSDPSTLYATRKGWLPFAPWHLYVSRDDGRSWIFLVVPDDLTVGAVAVDPADPNVLLVGIGQDPRYSRDARAGVFRSEDGGATFERVEGFPRDPQGRKVAVSRLVWSAVDRNVVWAVGGTPTWDPVLLRSEDAGRTWLRADGALVYGSGFAVAPSNPRIAYAYSSRGVSRTIDGGLTWEVRNAGLTFGRAMAVSPRNPDMLLASFYGSPGLLATVDGGATWHPAGDGFGPGSDASKLSFDPATPGRAFASANGRLFVTEDDGTTWRLTAGGACPGDAGDLLFGADGALYVNLDDRLDLDGPLERGFARSRDGGLSFENPFRELAQAWVSAISTGVSPGTLLAGVPGRPRRSEDRGRAWEEWADASTDCVRDLTAFARDSSSPGRLYAASDTGVFSSVDDGRSWQRTGPSVPFRGPTAIRRDPRPGGPLFVVARGYPNIGVVRDGGSAPANHETTGLFRSADDGRTFARVDQFPETYAHPLRDVAFDPRNPDIVWAAGALGLRRSTDRGLRFSPVWDQVRLTALAFDATNGTRLVVATEGFGIFTSVDDGRSFVRSTGLPTVRQDGDVTLFPAFTALVADPSSPGTLYAGASTLRGFAIPVPGGVFVSSDGGVSWSALSNGLTADVNGLALETGGQRRLHAGTTDGVFTLDLAGPTLESVLPGDGATEGGTLVLVKGRGFTAETRVFFDGLEGTERTFFDETTLRVRTPSHAAGLVAVSVVGGSGESDERRDAFRYADWSAGCAEDSATLCLERGRFSVRVETPDGGRGHAFSMTAKTGGFWLSIREGLDVVVKVLDGRTIDGRYWIHHAGLTERAYTVVVTDTVTGTTRRYEHGAGPPGSEIDRESFP